MRRFDGFAESRHQEIRALLGTDGIQDFRGLIPIVHGEANAPQWTGRNAPPPSSCNAFSAFSGPRWMSPQRRVHGTDFKHGQGRTGPTCSRIVVYSVVKPVSPLKNTRDGVARPTIIDDHNVAFPVVEPPAQKCCVWCRGYRGCLYR